MVSSWRERRVGRGPLSAVWAVLGHMRVGVGRDGVQNVVCLVRVCVLQKREEVWSVCRSGEVEGVVNGSWIMRAV